MQRYSEERSNLKAMHDYVASVVENEQPLDMLIGIQNTKGSTVVHRQNPVQPAAAPAGKISLLLLLSLYIIVHV